MTKNTGYNRRLAKKRVLCLNEALCFVSSSVLADSLVLRNPLLRQAPTVIANRTQSFQDYEENNIFSSHFCCIHYLRTEL